MLSSQLPYDILILVTHKFTGAVELVEDWKQLDYCPLLILLTSKTVLQD